jgi:hypothetical protein
MGRGRKGFGCEGSAGGWDRLGRGVVRRKWSQAGRRQSGRHRMDLLRRRLRLRLRLGRVELLGERRSVSGAGGWWKGRATADGEVKIATEKFRSARRIFPFPVPKVAGRRTTKMRASKAATTTKRTLQVALKLAVLPSVPLSYANLDHGRLSFRHPPRHLPLPRHRDAHQVPRRVPQQRRASSFGPAARRRGHRQREAERRNESSQAKARRSARRVVEGRAGA